MKITVSVPGKIHLMGEHAVVHGKPGLLAAINKRLVVTVCEGTKDLEIHAPEGEEYIKHAVDIARKDIRQKDKINLNISVVSEIPIGFHLGSSAAIAVGVVGACLYFFTKTWDLEKINVLAYEVEKRQHGTPSGGDNTIVTYGGLVWYRKEFEFLKNMTPLAFRPHPSLKTFYLINTGRPVETTGEMVAMVRERVENEPRIMQDIFNENERQTKRLTVALKDGNEGDLVDAIQKGEQTLEDMGVVSETVKPLIRDIERLKSGVKILGGGGKERGVGFLLCYSRKMKEVKKICGSYNYPIEQIVLGEEGIRLESTS